MDEIETNDPAPVATEEDHAQPETEVAEQPAPESSSTQRVFTIMRGNRVDITGLGVDPIFWTLFPRK